MSHKKIPEEKFQVPIWVITFSDMTTNLLTFFVLLVSMGSMRDETLFDQGQAMKFLESVKSGFGFKEKISFGNIGIKYHITNPGELSEGRTINAKEEEIRRLFKNLSRSMKTMPSQITTPKTNFSVTDIHFGAGEAILNEPAERFLTEFCSHLQQAFTSEPITLYVLGLACDEATEQEQWILSARRAKAVADYLRSILTSRSGFQTISTEFGGWSKWSVYWWGAGPGGDWVRQDSPISKQSQILIAVLRAGD